MRLFSDGAMPFPTGTTFIGRAPSPGPSDHPLPRGEGTYQGVLSNVRLRTSESSFLLRGRRNGLIQRHSELLVKLAPPRFVLFENFPRRAGHGFRLFSRNDNHTVTIGHNHVAGPYQHAAAHDGL